MLIIRVYLFISLLHYAYQHFKKCTINVYGSKF